MTKIKLSALALTLQVGVALSQSLPAEWRITPDGKRLIIGDQANTGLYDQSLVKSIYLTFPQTNYWTLMQNNYASQTDIPATMVVDGVTYDSVGVRFKGQTSYQQTQSSQKKSFNITVDYVDPNQKLEGYQTLNLNNCFQDESFLREVFFQNKIKKYIPAAKSAFVKLYINGANWGVYPNVQQLNKDFLEEWYLSNDGTHWRADRPPGSPGGPGGGWGDGTAALNYLGATATPYQSYYTLKSTNSATPWNDLINTTNILNNTPLATLPTALPAVMDIDKTLWHLAAEVLFADDDSYIYKGKMDYYVYHELETGRITPHEYDGNSVMDPAHQTWSAFYNETNVNYPLMNKLFAVPEWRQRYLAHLRTMISEVYDTSSANGLLNTYKALIDTMVQNDPKKLYTYAQFNSELNVLKNFITARKNSLNANTQVAVVSPVISNTSYYTSGNAWTAPNSTQTVTVRSSATHSSGIFELNVYYSTQLVGNFTKLQMFDDGAHDDGAAADGVYGAIIPAQAGGTWVRWYVEAAASNTAKTVSYDPLGAEHDVYIYVVAPNSSTASGVVINEVMASNATVVADNAGEFDDWIELYNTTANPVDISGFYLTDNVVNLDKFQMPAGTIIQPNDYLIIWADEDSSQGAYHANFKLSGSGEQLMFLDGALALIDSVSWGAQTTDLAYARRPNGTGSFIIQQATHNYNNDLVSVNDVAVTPLAVSVYPNPAKDNVTITLNGNTDQPLYIFNSVGQILLSIENPETVTRISTAGYASGVYFVKCGSVNKKVVVQK
ncbi:MAG: CotH kinase family protein [Bacteroidetes bacterium]|nr:CotH kinase family protein [Bacteroidota bacterium]